MKQMPTYISQYSTLHNKYGCKQNFQEDRFLVCVNAEREQQHGDQCSGSSSLKPTYKYANFQDDACSTHRYCSITVSSSVTFKEETLPWQEITPCITL